MSIDGILLKNSQVKGSLAGKLGFFERVTNKAKAYLPTQACIKVAALTSLAAIALFGANNLRAATKYVDDNAVGSNDGSSWVNAYPDLQAALAAAEPNDIINVAQGTYKPDSGTHDREAAFNLPIGITIIGGFAGIDEPDPYARDIISYQTILSGDLIGNDPEVDNPSNLWGNPRLAENSYHVVTCFEIDETAVLDGVTITGGNANGPERSNDDYGLKHGAAMYIWDSDPNISNCTFAGNSGWSAVYIYLSDPNFSNCNFTNNLGLGGAIRNLDSNTILVNCNLSKNHGEYGGAIGNVDSNITLIGCIIEHCMADFGGGLYSSNSRVYIENCNVLSNFAPIGGGIYFDNNSTEETFNNFGLYDNVTNEDYKVILKNCAFIRNSATTFGGGILNLGSTSEVKNSIVVGNTLEQITDPTSQANITYCCIQGGYPGQGNIDEDPMFIYWGYMDDNGTPDRRDDVWVPGDYHLQSKGGRYDPVTATWVIDGKTSPCIDAGDPDTEISYEPLPNGGIINMGAYGGTIEASKSYQPQNPISEKFGYSVFSPSMIPKLVRK